MDNYCVQCKRVIDEFDFYMESRNGNICSTCLVREHLPRTELKTLFAPRPLKPSTLAEAGPPARPVKVLRAQIGS
ncbi:MAG: hypothetical protein V3573_00805 [Desulfovibrionaceae bacterium]